MTEKLKRCRYCNEYYLESRYERIEGICKRCEDFINRDDKEVERKKEYKKKMKILKQAGLR